MCAVQPNADGEVRHIKLPCLSLESLSAAIRSFFRILKPMRLEYFNPTADLYVLLKEVADLGDLSEPRIRIEEQGASWWDISRNGDWEEEGYGSGKYFRQCLTIGRGIPVDDVNKDKFDSLLHSLGADDTAISSVYAVRNPSLVSAFEIYRDLLFGRQGCNEALFKRKDWYDSNDLPQRSGYIETITQFAEKFKEWNNGSLPSVIPMFHGTSEIAAWQIAQLGFANARTKDDGFFGAGVYFTSKLSYAAQYSEKDKGKEKFFILSMVIPGNVFPVTENPHNGDGKKNRLGYMGCPCRVGYQSHYTHVSTKTCFPVKDDFSKSAVADELVVFESAQALPLFVFSVKY